MQNNSMSFKVKNEDIEDEEEIEYVVERLDDDDDEEIDEDHSKYVEDDTEYVDEDEDDNLGITKKIKNDNSVRYRVSYN